MLLAALPIFLCLAVMTNGQIVINEIHPTPVAGEPEWVEVVNTSARSLRVRNWLLCDARTCVRLDDVTIPSHGFAVITRDTSALAEARHIDAGAVLIEVHAPSLNNTTDRLAVRDADSVLIDSIAYTMAWGRKGVSLERSTDAVGQTRWMASVSDDSATCGYLNSTVVLERDLRCMPIAIDAQHISIVVGIMNFGRQSMPSAPVSVSADGRVIRSYRTPALPPGEHVTWSIPASDLRSDTVSNDVDVRVRLTIDDDRAENDAAYKHITLPPAQGTVTINEVMFDPAPLQCDYVEVLNRTGGAIDLKGWMLCDGTGQGSRDTFTVTASVVVNADSCGVIATDTIVRAMMTDDAWSRTFPHGRVPSFNLNADGDDVVLLNPSGFMIDSTHVDASWHSGAVQQRKGVSLERLSPILAATHAASWSTSGAQRGGTPGAANTVTVRVDTAATVLAHPSPFSSANTHPLHPCVISWRMPYAQCTLTVRILSEDGVIVRELLNNAFGGSTGAVAWDGYDDVGRRCPPGPYVAVVVAVDPNRLDSRRALTVVVVGE